MQNFTTRAAALLTSALLILLTVAPVFGEDEDAGIDRLGLAALLIKDGHFDRAEAVLAEIDETEVQNDLGRLRTLWGLLYLRRGLFVEAKEQLSQAAAFDGAESMVYVYLAQAHYGLGEYDESLAAIAKAGETAHDLESIYLLEAQCHWKMGRREEAWRVASDGIVRYPGNDDLARQRVFYLIEMGLFQEAGRLGWEFLGRSKTEAADFLGIGEALRQSRRHDQAKVILEEGLLRFPGTAMC
ncbi:MAG: hypothetical protein M5R36_00850 [Deltaproteobacteria bacterium]|nr:hypothetical protein [Deltaproteobacteria bacterium]